MTKTGKIEPGTTPSEVSGRRSTRVVRGVPLADGEAPSDDAMAKLAAAVPAERKDAVTDVVP